jgi:hypothetical protein
MPALVAGIHVLRHTNKDVDGRNKSGHDESQAVICLIAVRRRSQRPAKVSAAIAIDGFL